MKIRTLLIANRGEIADRVIRTARDLGIRTVAVYSDADREAPYVRLADTAVHLGPTPAAESYLNIEKIIDAAKRSGADAVHPGYGFLSERAGFARAVVEAGLVFVGPTGDVMDRMGRKDIARDVAVAAGVPVVPSAALTGDEVDASEIGFPLLVKAAAGGGGKGMRIVRAEAELAEALASARREAKSGFGDDTLLVERYVEHGRHVEVQVLGDEHGTVVHLYDRDCSVQRRHQKVIEEAPAPTISDGLRDRMTSAAVALATEVGYTNAGTVEFLVNSVVEPGRDQAFYFLEMNTRLQVEAPVTEAVVSTSSTGEPIDLVALQLLVAAGQPLPFSQADVTLRGHAIEARVYAEDAFAGFLPQAGVAERVRWPSGYDVQVHQSFESGQTVTTSYDPMLAKIVATGDDREEARMALVRALDETVVLGVTTNLGFLRNLAAGEEFADAAIDTSWLDRNPEGVPRPTSERAVLFAAVAAARATPADPGHPFGASDGWRVAGPAAPTLVLLDVDGEARRYRVGADGSVGSADAPDRVLARVGPHATDDGDVPLVALEIDGILDRAHALVGPHAVEVSCGGQSHLFVRPDAFGPGAAADASDGSLLAPMPGTVLAVNVAEGDVVEADQSLGVIEAMKMELTLKAPFAGTVTKVGAKTGDQVGLKQLLFTVEPGEGGPA